MKKLPLSGLLLILAFSSPAQSAPRSPTRLTRPVDLALVSAAQKGQTEQITLLLKKGANIKTAGSRALLVAVEANHPEVVRTLIKQGAPISFRALIRALNPSYSTVNAVKMTQILLNGGAKVNEIGPEELDQTLTTPLITAIRSAATRKNAALPKLLLSRGAQVNLALPNGTTALDLATDSPNLACILIEHGANLTKNKKELLTNALRSGSSPLLETLRKHWAVPAKLSFAEFDFPTNVFAVKNILANGGNPNERFTGRSGWTMLHLAAASTELESISALLDAGANIESKADYSRDESTGEKLANITPAFMAGVFRGHPERKSKTLELLLQRGANPNAIDGHNGWSLLMWEVISGKNNVKEIEMLLKAGANINLTDQQGETVLHWAAITDNAKLLQALLKANQSPEFINTRDKDGVTALLWSVAPLLWQENSYRGSSSDLSLHLPTIATLVKAGADIRAQDNNGATVFHRIAASHSALNDMKDMSFWQSGFRNSPFDDLKVMYFWQLGLKNIDDKDKRGATPLYIACDQGKSHLAEIFLALGADPDVQTASGDSPRKLVSRPVHIERPEARNAEDKKRIESWFQVMDQALVKQHKSILAFMNKKRPSK